SPRAIPRLRSRPFCIFHLAASEPRAPLLLSDHAAKRPIACAEQATRRSNNFDLQKLRARFAAHSLCLLAPARCFAAQKELILCRSWRWHDQSRQPVRDRAAPCYKARRAVSSDLDTRRPHRRSLEKCQADRRQHRKFRLTLPTILFVRSFLDRIDS